jgi:hypothetical protein
MVRPAMSRTVQKDLIIEYQDFSPHHDAMRRLREVCMNRDD